MHFCMCSLIAMCSMSCGSLSMCVFICVDMFSLVLGGLVCMCFFVIVKVFVFLGMSPGI